MNRRSALGALAAGAVGASASGLWVESLIAAARQEAHAHAAQAAVAVKEWAPQVLSARQNEMVIVVTELIIPETDTPGAKQALVNRFIDHVLTTAEPGVRERFLKGMSWIDARSRALYKKDLVDATVAEQTDLLTRLSAQGNPHNEERVGVDFFRAIKSMTIDGYYSTEIGLRQELGDPGELYLTRFPGCAHPEHGA